MSDEGAQLNFKIVLTTVGKLTLDTEADSFLFEGQLYSKLLVWDDFTVLLNLKKHTGYSLEKRVINGQQYVVLLYSSANVKWSTAFKERQENKFLLKSFFDESREANVEESQKISLDSFYEILRQAHENDDLTNIPQDVQHQSLRPVLRPYQMNGIKWMLKRELQPDQTTHQYIRQVTSKFNSSQVLYYNYITQQLLKEAPEPLQIPPGGLLTDEMGLGKTIEMIGLLLMNPRRLKRKIEEVELENVAIENDKDPIKCICRARKSNKMKTIQCSNCKTAQHVTCMFQQRTELSCDDRSRYMCPQCWKSTGKIIEAKTTIIVTPASIKNQWNEEVQRHVADKSFSILMYNGISSGWISPPELAKYDIVVTDFNTLSTELYFSDRTANDRSLRQSKKWVYPPSPLTSIEWWRVVLDEAQMVENKNNRPSQMVKLLPSVNRWGTTGTPIEKGSFGCLYGLLFFINFEPYTDESAFYNLINGPSSKMVEVLSKVMWRTCKKNVADEVGIPEQTERVHTVEMTNLQECYYRQVHINTKPLFLQNIESYLLRQRPWMNEMQNGRKIYVRASTYDPSLRDRFLCDLDQSTMKVFTEPLRRLRQDCTIPSIFHQTNDNARIRQVLRPEQLHDHLVSKTSLETKSALRTICSSINGMAAIKISEEKYDEAVSLYNQVLKLGREFTGFVAVDSMLQIHSYNSLLEISEVVNIQEVLKKKDEYRSEMNKLEWKYISKYYDVVLKVKEELMEHRPEMKKTKNEYADSQGMWWRDIIHIRKTAEEEARLMDTINLEVFSSIIGVSQIASELRSSHGIELIVTEWSDKIKNFTKGVNDSFKKMAFVVENLQPTNLMSEEDQEKLNVLAAAALNCHLNLFEENSDDESTSNRQRSKKKGSCDLCKLKSKLNEYECVLFNKSLVDDVAEGTWNPRLEEKLLKAVLNYAKRSGFEEEFTETGQKFFNRLEALKTQYKLLAKLWVEVNYTISAYDEINMCKSRMQVVEHPDEMTEEDAKYHLKITRAETAYQLQIFADQKLDAEVNFARFNGRLKYLQHLKEKNEPQACSICTNVPRERYFVTVCGHFICSECFPVLTKNKSRSIKCPVCRTMQEITNIYAITCGNQGLSLPINGTYSPKIDEITRCILALIQNEPDVKILIFSHWDQILQAITAALVANKIEFRSSYTGKFVKQIAEFKDFTRNVTCMMMNLKFGGKGLNLIEATHVFLVEPILNADEELQAIARISRIGQTRETVVHRFITRNTIEEKLHDKITNEKEKWSRKKFTIRDLEELVDVNFDNQEQALDEF